MSDLGTIRVILRASMGRFVGQFKDASAALRESREAFSQVALASGVATAAITAAGAAAMKTAAQFEATIVSAAALANQGRVTAQVFGAFEEKALEVASATEFTSRQVGEAMEFMAKAGQNPTQVMGNLRNVLQLATSASIDVARAADITTNIMAGFGKTTEELAHTNDVLVSAFTGANVDLQMLGESFAKVGPAARMAGVSFEETTAALAALGNVGIQSGIAGRGLRRMLIALQKPSKASAAAMTALGLKTTDAAKGFTHITQKLEEARAKMRPEAFSAAIFTVFDSFGGATAQALVGAGSDALERMNDRLAESAGIAARIEKAKIETFAGQFKIMQSEIERLTITLGKQFFPLLRPVMTEISRFAAYLSKLSSETHATIAKIALAAVVIGALVTAIATAAAGMGAFIAIWPLIKAGVLLALLPLLKLILILGAIVFAVGLVRKAWEENWGMIREATAATWADIKLYTAAGIKAVLTAFFTVIKKITEGINWVTERIAFVAGLPFLLFAQVFDGVLAKIATAFRRIEKIMGGALRLLADGIEAFPNIADALGLDAGKVKRFAKSLDGIARGLEARLEVGGMTSEADDTIRNMQDLLRIELEDPERIADAVMQLPGEIWEALKAGGRAIKDDVIDAGHGLRGMAMAAWDGLKLIAQDVLGPTRESEKPTGEGGGLLRPRNFGEDFGEGGLTGTDLDDLRKAQRALADMMQRTADRLAGLRSAFPGILEIGHKLRDDLAGLATAAHEAGLSALDIGHAFADARDAAALEIAERISSMSTSREMAEALEYVRENADELGVAFDDVRDAVKKIPFDKLQPDAGLGVSGIFEKGLTEKLSDAFSSPEVAKAFAENTSAGLGSLLGGDGGGLGSIIGGGLGALAPTIGVSAGATIGLAVAGAITDAVGRIGESMGVLLEGAADLLTSDPTVRGTVESFTAAFAPAAAGLAILGGIALALGAAFVGVLSFMAMAAAPAMLILAPLWLLVALLSLLASVVVGLVVAVVGAIAVALAIAAVWLAAVAVGILLVTGIVGVVAAIATWIAALVLGPAVIFGVISALIYLVGQTETFQLIVKAMGLVMEELIGLLEPFAAQFLFLIPLLQGFVAAFVPVINALTAGDAVARVLFNILKTLAVAFLSLVKAVFDIANVLNRVAAFIVDVIESGLQLVRDATAAMGGDTSTLDDVLGQLADFGAALDQTVVDTSAMQAAIDELRGMTFDEAVRAGQAFVWNMQLAAEGVGDAARAMQDSMLNVPEGFKVARARFAAIDASNVGAPAAVGETPSSGGGNVFNIRELVIEGSSKEELIRALLREAELESVLQTGTPSKGSGRHDRGKRIR